MGSDSAEARSRMNGSALVSANELNLSSCHVCGVLQHSNELNCARCNATLHVRKRNSVQRTWALLVASILFYIPAMLYPVSTIQALGTVKQSTLMGSVIHFLQSSSWPIGIVIFIASVAVPLFKIFGLGYLLVTVQVKSRRNQLPRTRLYRVIELVGRWSMIDVFVIAILVALVQVGIFINIVPGVGIVAFTGVVIFTMFAAMSFDPRLIWDQ